ncbi:MULTISPECIES: hypothetical protein [unclassified Corynebacterium]|uniref:hypothetical protein n=1 Tax=unclassified Corynebacterium TaxID=2624378 RepID=UPI0030A3E83D
MILLVDGRSGSGKTTFACHLQGVLGWPVLHVEDMYPGWSGLAEASDLIAESVLNPALPAERRGFHRWDWYAYDFAEWVRTPSSASGSLIVEGCGALTKANVAAARGIGDGEAWGVWLDLDREARRARALRRDPEFATHWEMWAEQENAHYSAHVPWELADWIVRR